MRAHFRTRTSFLQNQGFLAKATVSGKMNGGANAAPGRPANPKMAQKLRRARVTFGRILASKMAMQRDGKMRYVSLLFGAGRCSEGSTFGGFAAAIAFNGKSWPWPVL
jgi:hypothetical protein